MNDALMREAQPFNIKKERRFIFFAFLILTLFGILMVYESSSLYAYKTTSDYAYFFIKQFIFFVIGLTLFFLTLLINLDFLRKHIKEFLLFTILILIVLLIIGKKAGGAKRWFHLWGFNFQPSELLKIFFLIYCADYVVKRKSLIRKFHTLIPVGLVLGLICAIVVVQPDLGTAIFWILWTFLFFLLYRVRARHLFLIILIGVVLSFFFIKFYPYRFRRITAYLNPFADPRDAGFQLIQSQIAYGQGGIFGVGLGEGIQKLFFLPAAHTDFIFSIIAEEFGLLGVLSLLAIFFIIFNKMFAIAKLCSDEFRRGVLFGIILIFFLEIAINIGVSCGLFPTKGLPLPFISYGGSNLIVHYCLLALFFNASRKDAYCVEVGTAIGK
ncbi:MAG: putative lipid II flippase FtsW [Candidatus Omnitrophota bacterium]|nr:putative lipid II flippase FtsW [Candidatus Omnitrophota bacterium]